MWTLSIIFCCAVLVIFCGLKLLRWVKETFAENATCGMQSLVNCMKEYNLDARAGLIVCTGRDLRIRYRDPTLESLVGNPRFVEDLLPLALRDKHSKIVSRYVGRLSLPDTLNHPLRNVPILCKDDTTMNAKLIIGKFSFFTTDIFYVVIQPCANYVPMGRLASTGSFHLDRIMSSASTLNRAFSGTSIASNDSESHPWGHAFDHPPHQLGAVANACGAHSDDDAASCTSSSCDFRGIAEVYGLGAASYVGRGLVPATERYSKATVIYVDIVDFTRHCMEKGLDEIHAWMTKIHGAVDTLLERHAVRKVETRGDCVICVAGTNFVADAGGASRDLSCDQATRMLSFGHDLGLALSAIEGTQVRMGMATGSVVLTHIAHGGDTLPAKYIYGDTVNVACRMEQTGRVGAVQLAESAARAHAEENAAAVPPLQAKEVKGKGVMRTAFYDYVHGVFVAPEPPAAAPGAVPHGAGAATLGARIAAA